MRKLLFLLLFPFCVSAQFIDDFSDGNFTGNPVWTGDTAKFIINADTILQSNGNSTAADTLHLVTPNTILDSTEWQFFMKLAFNPTATTNYVKVYLVSDQSDLKNPLNGYFIRMGETGSSAIRKYPSIQIENFTAPVIKFDKFSIWQTYLW